MESLIIGRTYYTPEINFSISNLSFLIEGESRPENVSKFYEPIIDWLEKFKTNIINNTIVVKDNQEFTLILKLDYFNSSSIKYVYDILKKIEFLNTQIKNIKVVWHYNTQDEEMLENGEEFSKIINIPFELIEN